MRAIFVVTVGAMLVLAGCPKRIILVDDQPAFTRCTSRITMPSGLNVCAYTEVR